MNKFKSYIKLTRLNKPIGIYLLLWPSLIGLMLGVLESSFIEVKSFDWFLILLIAVLGTSAHFFIIKAYQLAQASILQPFNYLQLVFVSIIGIIFFNEILEIPVLLGSCIVVGAGLYSFSRDANKL